MSVEINDDVIGALVFFGLGLFFFFYGFRHLRNKRLVENIPTSKCRSVAMGLVEVAGRAAGNTTVPSGIGQVPCYCSQIMIERYERRGKSSRWVTVHKENLGIPFYVEDDTGRVKVDPTGAELDLPVDIQYTTESGVEKLVRFFFGDSGRNRLEQEIERRFRDFCESRGVRFTGPMRFTEKNLCQGDPVYVLGTATEVPGAQDEQERIIICKGQHHPWYFIAEASEKEVLSKLSRNTWLSVFGGAVVALVALAWLLHRFGWLSF
ncbi:MAG: E3 ubiquitin ligase family protein [Acidobacteriia bacterium]|jgi:hypothetical protein|nr:E3 ubiquitin ligase family protein [Terriglobia bacterium]